MTDALTDILRLMRLEGCIYFQEGFSAPWGMDVGDSEFAQFHMVVSGHCWLSGMDNEDAINLTPGDIVVFPTGQAHFLGDLPDRIAIDGRDIVALIHNNCNPFAGPGNRTILICGHFSFDASVKDTLLRLLPSFIVVRRALIPQNSWLETVLHIIMEETSLHRQAGSVIAERLAEALFIEILRNHAGTTEKAGILKGLGDRTVKAALDALHDQPARKWTLEQVARQAGASRTSLALRFKQKMGITPMDYLTDLRMTLALRLLRIEEAPIIEIAERVGYASEAAFNRAFKKRFDATPGKMRRQLKQSI